MFKHRAEYHILKSKFCQFMQWHKLCFVFQFLFGFLLYKHIHSELLVYNHFLNVIYFSLKRSLFVFKSKPLNPEIFLSALLKHQGYKFFMADLPSVEMAENYHDNTEMQIITSHLKLQTLFSNIDNKYLYWHHLFVKTHHSKHQLWYFELRVNKYETENKCNQHIIFQVFLVLETFLPQNKLNNSHFSPFILKRQTKVARMREAKYFVHQSADLLIS